MKAGMRDEYLSEVGGSRLYGSVVCTTTTAFPTTATATPATATTAHLSAPRLQQHAEGTDELKVGGGGHVVVAAQVLWV